MEPIVIIVGILLVLLLLKLLLPAKEELPYRKTYLLTKNEYAFYQKIRKTAEACQLQILAKIRLADLVEVEEMADKKKWYRYFNQIKSKHIDFAVARNMEILFLIELDDRSHEEESRQKRDIFVNAVLEKTGYQLLRVHHDAEGVAEVLDEMRKYRR